MSTSETSAVLVVGYPLKGISHFFDLVPSPYVCKLHDHPRESDKHSHCPFDGSIYVSRQQRKAKPFFEALAKAEGYNDPVEFWRDLQDFYSQSVYDPKFSINKPIRAFPIRDGYLFGVVLRVTYDQVMPVSDIAGLTSFVKQECAPFGFSGEPQFHLAAYCSAWDFT